MTKKLVLDSFSARLVFGIVVLTLLTTLSAGVPAYWVAQSGLKRQAWQHLVDAQRTTQSLLQLEQDRLSATAALLGERPTLQRLLRQDARAELVPYLHAFRQQSNVDLLLLCDRTGAPIVAEGPLAQCPTPEPVAIQLLDERPIHLLTRWVIDGATGEQIGRITMAKWVDAAFLRELATNTGSDATILRADGTRLITSLPSKASVNYTAADDLSGILRVGTTRYFARRFALTQYPSTPLSMEVALPVDDLAAVETQARLILILSTSLMAGLGIVAGVWYVQRLMQPLHHLTQVAQQISQGDRTARIPAVTGPVEVATLTTALQQSQDSMVRALDDLAQARDWLDTLVQSIVEGVVTYDADGRVTFLNQTAATLAQLAEEDAIGRHVNDLFRVAEERSVNFLDLLPMPGSKARLELVKTKGEPRTPRFSSSPGQRSPRRIRATSAPSVKTVVEVTGARLPATDDQSAQTALVLRDITEEETLRHLRSYFLANITHEFRTPLSTLNASLELLMDEADTLSPVEIRELLKPVHLSLLGLRTLIDNLLESSSIEAGRFVIRKRPLDLAQILSTAWQMVAPLLERRQQELSLGAPSQLPPLQGDAARLTQVLVNLLSNAGKYSPIGQPIALNVDVLADRVRIAVADAGPGIPAEERTNVFRHYVRSSSQDPDQYGIGLGLYVVKTTVEAHGGRVGVDDNANGGSIFWFELPVDKEML